MFIVKHAQRILKSHHRRTLFPRHEDWIKCLYDKVKSFSYPRQNILRNAMHVEVWSM